jgi:hypothetical protein
LNLPSPPPHSISLQKSNKFCWLSRMLHPILLSQLLCRKIENCFHCLISVPGKGKGESGRYLCLAWGQWNAESRLQGQGAVLSDPQSVCKDQRRRVGGGTGLACLKHNSPWGGLLQTGRVWAGSERSCSCRPFL